MDVLIRVLTEQVGPQKAQDVLKQVQAETANTTKATQGLGEATKEATGHHEKFIGKSHELRGVLHLLGDQFKELAGIGHFLFSPTGVLLAGVLLFTRLLENAREAAALRLGIAQERRIIRLQKIR